MTNLITRKLAITRKITDTKVFTNAKTAIKNYNFNKDMKNNDVAIKIDVNESNNYTVTKIFTRKLNVEWSQETLDKMMQRTTVKKTGNESRIRTVEIINVVEY